jgi:hypothetical protein
MSINNCRLCGSPQTVNSHIIPKFIIRWMNKTGTGRLRQLVSPNIPVQDGLVKKLLCSKCEVRFSKAERYFANKMFFPVADSNQSEIEYDHNIKYFIISALWRILIVNFLKELEDSSWSEMLQEIERQWADFLLLDLPIKTESFGEIHLLVGVDVIENRATSPAHEFEEDFIRYMARMIDAGAPYNEDMLLFYYKIPRFLFLFPIMNVDTSGFINSKIHDRGIYKSESVKINSPVIVNYFRERMVVINDSKKNISENQKKNSEHLYFKNIAGIENKDFGKINKYINKKRKN